MIRPGHRTFDEVRPVLLAAAETVEAQLVARYRAERGLGPDEAHPPMLGRAPKGPVKFLVDRVRHVDRLREFLPLFADAGRTYEIGVGVGYFMRAAIDVLGLDIAGCDIRFDVADVYRAMRQELGLADRVEEQGIYRDAEFRLPAGTRSVVTFLSMFDKDWGVGDYRWFLERCRETGVERVFWFGNPNTVLPANWTYLTGLGECPLPSHRKNFVMIDLARLG